MTVSQIDTPELYQILEDLRDSKAIDAGTKPKDVHILAGQSAAQIDQGIRVGDLATFRSYWYKYKEKLWRHESKPNKGTGMYLLQVVMGLNFYSHKGVFIT